MSETNENGKRQVIDKGSAISIGLVIMLLVFAVFIGSLKEKVSAVESKVENNPTRYEFEALVKTVNDFDGKLDKILLTKDK